jgi:hypothetical protein
MSDDLNSIIGLVVVAQCQGHKIKWGDSELGDFHRSPATVSFKSHFTCRQLACNVQHKVIQALELDCGGGGKEANANGTQLLVEEDNMASHPMRKMLSLLQLVQERAMTIYYETRQG